MRPSWWTGLLQERKTAMGNARMNLQPAKFVQKLSMDVKPVAHMQICCIRPQPSKNMQLTCITTDIQTPEKGDNQRMKCQTFNLLELQAILRFLLSFIIQTAATNSNNKS